jgi:Flp pilus assembly protein TadG
MTRPIERARRFVKAFLNDTGGIILPYAALLLTAFIGMAALAIDTGRHMSLQTQMQAAADAMAIAGARELDQRAGSRDRADQAIANLVSNGLTGFGSSTPIAAATTTFYQSLPAASTGFTGTAATGDLDARYVAVTVTPKTVPSMFPIFSSNISAGAQAIAGHTADRACGIAPVFICNPYEQSGDSDLQATQRLITNLDPNAPGYSSANLRKLIRWKADNTSSPGHFGWLQPTDGGCNSTTCLNKTLAYDTKAALQNSCYTTAGVKMATGNKPVGDSMNDRFDLYNGNGPSALFSPAINVRKGYTLSSGTDWCGNKLIKGDYLSAQAAAAANVTVSLVPTTTNVTATGAPSKKNGSTTSTITVASAAGIVSGMSITSSGALVNNTPSPINITPGATVANVTGNVITLNGAAQASLTAISVPLTFQWLTTGLPLDKNWTGICTNGVCLQGDGNWDCLNYWKINHGALAPPAGCTASNPTVSRFDIYNAENLQAAHSPAAQPPKTDINDWSGIPQGVKDTPGAETGAPMCAISKNFTPVWDSTYDPRILYAAIINCSAQATLGNIGGGNSGNGTPTSKFGKVFLTQPYNSDGQNYLYGEMTGLVTQLSDSVVLLDQVQLYR